MAKNREQITQLISQQLLNETGAPGTRPSHGPTGWQYYMTTLQTFIIFFAEDLGMTFRVGDVIGFFYTKVDGVSEPEEVCVGFGEVDSQIYDEYPIFTVHIVLDDGSSYSSNYLWSLFF